MLFMLPPGMVFLQKIKVWFMASRHQNRKRHFSPWSISSGNNGTNSGFWMVCHWDPTCLWQSRTICHIQLLTAFAILFDILHWSLRHYYVQLKLLLFQWQTTLDDYKWHTTMLTPHGMPLIITCMSLVFEQHIGPANTMSLLFHCFMKLLNSVWRFSTGICCCWLLCQYCSTCRCKTGKHLHMICLTWKHLTAPWNSGIERKKLNMT